MTILVTGGAGYIGSHMVWDLLDHNEPAIVLDDLSTGFDWALPGTTELVHGDVADPAVLDRILGGGSVEAVIHFAGSVIVSESVADPLKYYRNNTAASRVLIDACVRHGVEKFIFSSTAAVYGNPAAVPVPEDAVLVPMSPYGTSKLMTEWMLRDVAAAHDLTYCVLRYFNVAGADPAGRTGQSTRQATHLIKVACQAALGLADGVAVYGQDYDTQDGTGVRDYIHVSDLVSAHRLALDYLRDGGASRVMNCGYGHGFSVLQVLDTVRAVAGTEFPVSMAARRPGDSPQVVAAADRVRQTLGWSPRHDDLREIVGHALSWEQHLTRRNSY